VSLLGFERVSKEYLNDGKALRALDGISLEIEQGEFVALVGRSGCGKSTLLNLAGAMDFPTSGRVLLDGISTSDLRDGGLTRLRRNKVGFVFQSFQLLYTLTAVENVELPLLLAGEKESRDRARETLRGLELEALANRYPNQLSGGEMQRVAIARAVVRGPKLLLADEPTGNLDSCTGDVVLQLLQRINAERRTTIVMATHSPELAAAAGRIVRLRDGRVEELKHP
jgi:ABC-type lipoprotein export system ATPase subunit